MISTAVKANAHLARCRADGDAPSRMLIEDGFFSRGEDSIERTGGSARRRDRP